MSRIQNGLLVLLVAAAPACGLAEDNGDKSKQREFFTKRIEPLLKKHCYKCHSHGAKKAKGGLVLDSRSGWETGGESGPAIAPGKPEDSLLISAVKYEGLEMPPGSRLPAELVEQLQKWVKDGAFDPRVTRSARTAEKIDLEAGRRHWAFRPLQKTVVPKTKDEAWPRTAADQFVLDRLEKSGLIPISDADSYTWLRRVSFDLIGLPPTLAQIQKFVADRSPQAKEKVVDRLLGSKAFGERWARHWLDLVGYADQVGTSNSVFAQHAWRYRDYVISAYNDDKPFVDFIREQIAGDLLNHDTPQAQAASMTATGFLVLGDVEIVEADKKKLLVDIVDQQLNKVGKAFLGLTLECARCHDHKFDPIPQRDYYAMGGFFHGTSSVFKTERGVWSDIHVLDLPETNEQKAERAKREKQHEEKLKALETEREEAKTRKAKLDGQLKKSDLSKEDRDRLTKERDEKNGRIGQLHREIEHARFFAPTVPQVHGVMEGDPQDMRITIRGNPRALGDSIPRGFLQVSLPAGKSFTAKIEDSQSGRREFAEWITRQPLTARVVVNRIWQKLFGEGIVRTVDYFGIPGDRPSHPELLDYLAAEFVKDGWSQKRLIRKLVLSRTYGLDSNHDVRGHASDPNNRMLWRMNRVRLDAEALRDGLLFVAGKLTSKGGPPLPLEYLENVGGLGPKNVNPPNFRLSRWRPDQEFERPVYLPIIRHANQPGPGELRNVFDFAQPSIFTGKRAVTAVPTQALFLMNSPTVKKYAADLATRLSNEPDEEKRLEQLWLTLLNRPLSDEDRRDALVFMEDLGENAWPELCHALLASNEFLMRL